MILQSFLSSLKIFIIVTMYRCVNITFVFLSLATLLMKRFYNIIYTIFSVLGIKNNLQNHCFNF